MSNRFNTILGKVLISLWVLYVVIGYLIYRPYYIKSVSESPYFGVLLTLVLIGAVLAFVFSKFKWGIRPYVAYLVMLLFMMIIYGGVTADQDAIVDLGGQRFLAFVVNQVVLHLSVMVIFIACYVLGDWTRLIDKSRFGSLEYKFIAIVLGIIGLSIATFILTSLGIGTQYPIMGLVVVILLARYKVILELLENDITRKWLSTRASSIDYGLFFFILIAVAFYFIGAYKLFPIGFDSAAKYQNISNIVFETGSLVPGQAPYYWSLFTSIGAIMFGSISVSIFLSHAALVLVLIGLYCLSSKLLSLRYSMLFIAFLAYLPGISFLSYFDAKVDLGYVAILLAGLVYYTTYIRDYQEGVKTNWIKVYATIGLIIGFAVGVKYLAILYAAGIVGVILYRWGGARLILSNVFLFSGVLLFFNVQKFGYLDISQVERWGIVISSLVLSLGLLLSQRNIFKGKEWQKILKYISVMTLAALVVFSPCMIKNGIESNGLDFKNIMLGSSSSSARESFNYQWLEENGIDYKLSEDIRQTYLDNVHEGAADGLDVPDSVMVASFYKLYKNDRDKLKDLVYDKAVSGKKIEIERYLGYELGVMKYLSLPIDLTNGTNMLRNRAGDYGYLLLLILPIILLLTSKVNKLVWWSKLVVIFVLSGLSIASSFDHLGVSTFQEYLSKVITPNYVSDGAFNGFVEGFLYLQYSFGELFGGLHGILSQVPFSLSVLLCIIVTLFMIYGMRVTWRSLPLVARLLTTVAITFTFFWLVIGNAIPFYGLPAILLLFLLCFYWIEHSVPSGDLQLLNWVKRVFVVSVGLSLFLSYFVLFTNYSNQWKISDKLFERAFLFDASHFNGATYTFDKMMPRHREAVDILNDDLDKKIYRIGTFLNYHIKNNTERVVEDNQLNLFARTSEKLVNKADFIEALKKGGFKYIVFDLKSAVNDTNSNLEQSQRVQSLVSVLGNNPNLDIAFTDRIVERKDPNTGETKRLYGLGGGKTVADGSVAIFKIK